MTDENNQAKPEKPVLNSSNNLSSFDLTQKATQSGFARLMGVSQQAIGKQCEKGVLKSGESYLDWLRDYSGNLRDQAAGRAADAQKNVAQATVEEKEVKTALNRITYHEKLGRLIDEEEAFALLSGWAHFANRQILQAFERFTREVEGSYSIEILPEIKQKHVGTATERIRGYVEKLVSGSESGSGSVPEAEDISN